MSATWEAADPLPLRPLGWGDLVRAGLRGLPLLALLGAGLALLLLLRLVEAPLFRPRRPWTPWITVAVCRGTLRVLGLRRRVRGAPLAGTGAIVSNHVSWLDIFVLNAEGPMVFVAKSEVAGWAGIGWLARATGTVFVRREARGEAPRQVALLRERMARGERLVLFPEGTSTDGRRVLPFKPALLAAPLDPGLPPGAAVQPVSLAWEAPAGEDARFYGWFGDAGFAAHALRVLAARRQGGVAVTWHAPIPVAGRDRKSIARESEATVRAALP